MTLRRTRNAKIVCTLGPASSAKDMVRRLFLAGANVFRLNFSHGSAADHRARFVMLRELEQETGRPMAILADLHGPKLRVGTFAEGGVLRDAPCRRAAAGYSQRLLPQLGAYQLAGGA